MLRMRTGRIYKYSVVMVEDTIMVMGIYGALLARKKVKGFADFFSKAQDLRIGWGQLPDSEVIYLYDKDDDNFGYALNITDEQLSEWGYAPFPIEQAA